MVANAFNWVNSDQGNTAMFNNHKGISYNLQCFIPKDKLIILFILPSTEQNFPSGLHERDKTSRPPVRGRQ